MIAWLRLSRYGLLLVAAGLAGLIGAAGWSASGWLRAPAAALALAALGFGIAVLRRWRDKARVLAIADRRRVAGRFRIESMRRHCGDPCFRLVADEALRRAGLPRAERARRIATWRAELAREDRTAMIVDHRRGVVVTIVDGVRTEHQLGQASGSISPSDARPIVVNQQRRTA